MAIPDQVTPRVNVRSQEDDMARRRYQKDGWLRVEGDGWRLTYRKYDPAGNSKRPDIRIADAKAHYDKNKQTGRWKRIGPFFNRAGLDPIQAQQLAQSQYLDKAQRQNVNPQIGVKVEKFWNDNYLPNAKLRRLAFKTLEQYEGMFGKWIRPVIGHLPLSAVDLEVAEFVLACAREANLSDETVRHIRKVGGAVFTRAINVKAYSGFNPFRAVDLGSRMEPVREPYALTPDQARAVLTHELWTDRSSSRYVDGVHFALLTGCNVAEVCGLTGEHILEDRIQIRQQYFFRSGYGPLKARARRRDLPLTEELRSLIGGHEIVSATPGLAGGDRAGAQASPGSPIFAGQNGKPLNAPNIRSRYLRPIGEALGLPGPLGWHVFRHTFATWLQQGGVDQFDRKRLLGHAGDMSGHPQSQRSGVETVYGGHRVRVPSKTSRT